MCCKVGIMVNTSLPSIICHTSWVCSGSLLYSALRLFSGYPNAIPFSQKNSILLFDLIYNTPNHKSTWLDDVADNIITLYTILLFNPFSQYYYKLLLLLLLLVLLLKNSIVKLGLILTKVLTFGIALTLFLMSSSVTSMSGQFSLVDGKGYFPPRVTQGCSFC